MKAGELRFEFDNPGLLYQYTRDEAAILAAEQAK